MAGQSWLLNLSNMFSLGYILYFMYVYIFNSYKSLVSEYMANTGYIVRKFTSEDFPTTT